jgi:opacity protein-like surface antigen
VRNYLFATVALLTLAGPARAADIVFEPMLEAQGVMSLANQARELAQWVQQIAAMKQQYDQLVSTYNALAHVTDLSSAAYALGGLTRNYMPEAGAIPDLMTDVSNLWGRGAYFNSYDLYYASQMIDKWGTEMERRRAVTSNAKAMAAAGALDAQDHITKLAILQARLEAARDVTEVSAVNGLIALEQQNLDSHRAQIENVRLMMMADDRVSEQRAEQMQRESADRLMAATAPITDDLR